MQIYEIYSDLLFGTCIQNKLPGGNFLNLHTVFRSHLSVGSQMQYKEID